MGRRKGFDKKNSVTYSLIHTSAPAGEQSQRLWVEKSRGIGLGRPDTNVEADEEPSSSRQLPPSHPLAWLSEEAELELTAEQRQEIVDLGLPDDGYDYLKHLRDAAGQPGAAGKVQVSSNALAGSAVFVPAAKVHIPDEDAKIFQSQHLRLPSQARDEAEASSALPGVSAFSREVSTLWNKNEEELAELRKAMLQAEDLQDIEEDYQILDDFLVTATQDDPQGHHLSTGQYLRSNAAPAATRHLDVWKAESDDGSDASTSSALEEESCAGGRPRAPGSIASTYWRPERSDRNANLSVIDERFEQLALGYNSDEMGELEDDDETLQGSHALDQYSPLMNDFLEKHGTQDHAHESLPYDVPNQHCQQTEEEREAAIAIARAREHLHAAELRPEHPGRQVDRWSDEEPEKERWDCESVLTTLSNLDNHPGKILEPSLHRHHRGGQQPQIQLSARTGLPVRPSARSAAAGGRDVEHASRPQDASRQLEQGKPQQHHRGETAEQRRTRKASVKEARRKARANKKELKGIFKDEAQRHYQAGITASTIPL